MKRQLTRVLFIIIDIGIIISSFLFIAWFKAGTKLIVVNYARTLLAFGAIWLGVGLWGQKFTIKQYQTGKSFAKNMLKTDLVTLAIIFALIVLFQLFHYSRYIVFGTIGLTSILEFLFFVGLFYALQFHRENESYASAHLVTQSPQLEEAFSDRYIKEDKKQVPKPDTGPYHPNFGIPQCESIVLDLWKNYLANNQKLYELLNDQLDLFDFCKSKTLVLNSETYYNISGLDPSSLQIFINLHKINDFRRLNQYLIKVNQNLVQGGVFVCCGETITERRERFFRAYTPFLGVFVYFLDFVFRRMMPKIPILQGWYFALTAGKNRALSETEMIGRCYFCGFELVSKEEIENRMYFVLKKVKPWREDSNPSYGPLIKLRRIGQERKIIYINKLRTMHPYSEYLQDYVYQTNALQEGGKFSNDFRVTSWGKVFRTLWIDELPQIINFIKGEVSLVGVRALSEHYFNLYPADLQELRCKFKPGLVPPFYADMPKTFEEILTSERNYLEQKQYKPIFTDWSYFWKAFWNIMFKHARSN